MSDDGLFDESDVEYEIDSDGEDYPSSPIKVEKGKQRSDVFACQSFSPDKLEEEICKEVGGVVALLGLESSIATILLRQFRWNKDRLLDAYMESPGEVMKASGEPPSHIGPPNKRQRITPEEFVCDICCDTPPDSNIYKERCGHKFCKSCWRIYIVGKVKDEGQSMVSCMQEGCQTILESNIIRDLTDSQCYQRYRALFIESFVKDHSYLRFCPFPGCEQIVSCDGATESSVLTHVPIVACASSHTFCFGCGMDVDHRPVICPIADLWVKNVTGKDDSGTSQWIQANTKNCPQCKNPTEKNGGCNRILCRHCVFQWCWMCRKAWNVHGYNATCNAFAEKTTPETLDAKTQAQANLEKWLFYYDRYTNHELSAKLDQELYARTEVKMVKVQDSSGLSWIQARFMKDAVDELTKCRATLKWTYAMAFYIKKGNMKQIFEDVQADLEKAVEALSELLEEEVSSETVHSLRQRMLDKTVYVQKRHHILLEDTSVGLQEDRWQWTVAVE